MPSVLSRIAGTVLGATAGLVLGIPMKIVEYSAGLFDKHESFFSILYKSLFVLPIGLPFIGLRAAFAGIGEGLKIGINVGYEHGLSTRLFDIPKQLAEFEHGGIAVRWVHPKVRQRVTTAYSELQKELMQPANQVNFESAFNKIDKIKADFEKCERIEHDYAYSHGDIKETEQLNLTGNRIENQKAITALNMQCFQKLYDQINSLLEQAKWAKPQASIRLCEKARDAFNMLYSKYEYAVSIDENKYISALAEGQLNTTLFRKIATQIRYIQQQAEKQIAPQKKSSTFNCLNIFSTKSSSTPLLASDSLAKRETLQPTSSVSDASQGFYYSDRKSSSKVSAQPISSDTKNYLAYR